MFIRCFLLVLAFNLLSAGRVPLEERIIGGSDIEIEMAPWQVSLEEEGQHVCGGAIYSEDIIITAAHCHFDKEGRRLEAEVFNIRAGSALKEEGGRRIQVASIKSHQMYKFTRKVYDIAVMRLSEPLELSNTVQTIPLGETNPSPGTLAFISGWGGTSAIGVGSSNSGFGGQVVEVSQILEHGDYDQDDDISNDITVILL
nr:trypsin beta-like [Drosophila takahashii]